MKKGNKSKEKQMKDKRIEEVMVLREESREEQGQEKMEENGDKGRREEEENGWGKGVREWKGRVEERVRIGGREG